MTSKKSSLNAFGFTYRKNLKSLLPLAFALAIIIVAILNGIFSEIKDYKNYIEIGELSSAKYILNSRAFTFGSTGSMGDFAITVLLVVIGAAFAFISFKYLMSKKAINVYFSLGISRKRLFLSKFLAGVTAIAVSTFLPMLILALVNVSLYGSSYKLWFAAIYIAFKCFSVMFYVFTIFTFSAVLLGSWLETIVMGCVAVVSPFLVNYAVGVFASTLVFGSPYISSEYTTNMFSFSTLGGGKISPELSLFNFGKYIIPFSSDNTLRDLMQYSIDFLTDKEEAALFSLNVFKWPVFFLCVTVLVAIVSGILHSRRKAEITGFMGKSVFLEGYCVIVVGTFLASFVGPYIAEWTNSNYSGTVISILLSGIIIMAVGYTVVDLICVRSLKEYRKRIKNLFGELLAFTFAVAIVSMVFSGVCTAIPDKSEIESAGVTVVDAPLGNIANDSSYTIDVPSTDGSYTRLDNNFLELTYEKTVTTGFTEDDDIDLILTANNKIKSLRGKHVVSGNRNMSDDDVYRLSVRFEYKLKNGKTVSRTYYVSDNEIQNYLLALTSSDNYKNQIANIMTCEDTLSIINNDGYAVSFISPNASNKTSIGALYSNAELKTELQKALAADIKEGTLPLSYVSNEKLIGYIAYLNDISLTGEESETNQIILTEDYDLSNYESYYMDLPIRSTSLFPIYENMKNTVKFLEDNDFMSYFENKAEAVEISYCKYDEESDTIRSANTDGMILGKICLPASETEEETLYDEWGNELPGEKTYAERVVMPENSTVVTDKDEIEELSSKIRLRYPACKSGSYCRMTFEDGSTVFGYIPDALISE